MAKDSGVPAPRVPAAPIDQDEEFFKSEMGQDVERLFNEFLSGKKSYEDAYDEFNGKWADKLEKGQVAPTPSQVPNAPYLPVK